jgi:hypothetical protein
LARQYDINNGLLKLGFASVKANLRFLDQVGELELVSRASPHLKMPPQMSRLADASLSLPCAIPAASTRFFAGIALLVGLASLRVYSPLTATHPPPHLLESYENSLRRTYSRR